MQNVYWPFMAYMAIVFALVTAIIVISYFLGERHTERATIEPFESGMPPTGTARLRMSIKFYLVALFFVIFDVESVFIFAWAVAFKHLGLAAYGEVLFFIGVLVAAWIYLWRQGGLDWGTTWYQKQEQKKMLNLKRDQNLTRMPNESAAEKKADI
jgi:NADH-quinone oxidoreductase subunit A